jgi:protein-arginine kinase activator protein McsA
MLCEICNSQEATVHIVKVETLPPDPERPDLKPWKRKQSSARHFCEACAQGQGFPGESAPGPEPEE